MAIDYASLSAKQKTTYDFWVNVTKKDPDDPALEELLGAITKPKTRVRKELLEHKEAVSREAEAVLLHLRNQDTLLRKVCVECKLPFATNYHFAARCSDDCISTSLAKVGIKWNSEKTATERWNGPGVNGEVPAIVEPATMEFLVGWARYILEKWQDNKIVEKNMELIDVEYDCILDTAAVAVTDPGLAPTVQVASQFELLDDPFAGI